jgi:glutaredoxin-like YruB-family protein
MKPLFFIILFIGHTLCAQADIYKWVDEQGQVHYGDNPNDAQKQSAENISSYESVTYGDPQDMSAKPAPSSSQPAKKAYGAKVTMYSTEWCGYCKKARRYFQAKGIPFVEYDIEKNAQAKRAYDALGGKGVPVITMGKKRMSGFSPQSFERFYR